MSKLFETEGGFENEKQQRYFIAETTPEGDVPEEIRQEWIGVPLPILPSFSEGSVGVDETIATSGFTTDETQTDRLVTVVGVDGGMAVQALRDAGKEEAADYWTALYAAKDTIPDGDTFVFNRRSGRIVSAEESAPED